MKVKYKCVRCGKTLLWELSLWKRIGWLFKGKNVSKSCGKCYNEFKEGK